MLRLATSVDLVAHLDSQLAGLAGNGPLPAILACDCILRRLEAEHTQNRSRISTVLERYQVAGFNTYGEQFNMMHVNQTFTGLAFYPPQPEPETLFSLTGGAD